MEVSRKIFAGRKAGLSLLEVVIAIAVAAIFFGGVIAAMISETRAVDNSVKVLLAKSEADRAIMRILEDLQTTNTVETDDSGQPYIRVLGSPDGPGDKLWFRRVESFTVLGGADAVIPVYGSPVIYRINEENQLVRVQNGQSEVLANGISSLGFTIDADGKIRIELKATSGSGCDAAEITNTLSITPSNGYDR